MSLSEWSDSPSILREFLGILFLKSQLTILKPMLHTKNMTELQHHSDEATPDARQETYLRFQVGNKLAGYLLRPLSPQARAMHEPVLYADLHYPIPLAAINDPVMMSKASKIWQMSGERQLPVKNLIMQVRKVDTHVKHLVPGDHIDIGLGMSPGNHKRIVDTLSALGARGIGGDTSGFQFTPTIHFNYEELDGDDEASMEVSRDKVGKLLQYREMYNRTLGQHATSYFLSPPAPRR